MNSCPPNVRRLAKLRWHVPGPPTQGGRRLPFSRDEMHPCHPDKRVESGSAVAMVDSLTPEQRSERMSRIRASDTAPEMLVRRHLHALGFRYRLHARDLPGKPDLVLPKHGVVVFVHGCFWHAHSCQKGRIPATRREFWREKFAYNKARDARNVRALRRLGWRVATVWECSLSKGSTRQAALETLVRKIARPKTSRS